MKIVVPQSTLAANAPVQCDENPFSLFPFVYQEYIDEAPAEGRYDTSTDKLLYNDDRMQ